MARQPPPELRARSPGLRVSFAHAALAGSPLPDIPLDGTLPPTPETPDKTTEYVPGGCAPLRGFDLNPISQPSLSSSGSLPWGVGAADFLIRDNG